MHDFLNIFRIETFYKKKPSNSLKSVRVKKERGEL